MAILGADPDQLESTATRVLARADDYDDACNQIAYWLRRMDWQGPEADRFHAVFESQMRPQLGAAASFLRQAAGELRAQAAAQTKTSETPIAQEIADGIWTQGMLNVGAMLSSLGSFVGDIGGQKELVGLDAVAAAALGVGTARGYAKPLPGWIEDILRMPLGPTANGPIGFTDLIQGSVLLSDFVGLGHLAYLRYTDKLPKFGAPLPKFGIPGVVGKLLGGAGAGLGLLSLPGDISEIGDVFERAKEDRYVQPEVAADMTDAVADTGLDFVAAFGWRAPNIGLPLGAFFGGLKLGAQLDQPVIWLVDNVIYPANPVLWDTMFEVSDAVSDFAGDMWDAGTDLVGDAAEAVSDFAGDMWDAGTDLVGDAAEAVSDFAGDMWDAGTDLVGDAAEAVSDFAGDMWDAGTDFAGDVGDALVGGAKTVFGELNPFD